MNNTFTKVAALLGLTALVCGSGSLQAQNYITIGTGTATSGTFGTGETPFGTYYHDDQTLMLYTAAELQAAGASGGDILSIGFDVSSPATQAMSSFNISVGTTTASSLTGWIPGMTNVYSSTSQTLVTGWNDFTLPIPFNWNGSDNLVVQVCFDNSSYSSNSQVFMTSTSFTSTMSFYCDSWCGSGCSITNAPYSYSNRANTRFEFSPPFANNAGVSRVDTPYSPVCVLDTNVNVTIRNYGTDTLTNVLINWSVNGVTQTPVPWIGSLPALMEDTAVFLGTYNFQNNDVLVAWTSMPNNVPDSATMNDSTSIIAHTALNGTYSIDPSGAGDYSSISAAVAAMDMFGICGPTVFELASDVYNEQVTLITYSGMSATNNVTFTSAAGVADSVQWTFAGTGSNDNYIVKFDQAQHYTISDLSLISTGTSYTRTIEVVESQNIEVLNNNLVAPNSTSTSNLRSVIYANSTDLENIDFIGNTIEGGSYGVYWWGNSGNYSKNLNFENNMFYNSYYRYAYFYYNENLQLNGNEFYHDGTPYSFTSYGVYMVYNIGDNVNINNNFMHSSNGFPTYGMYLNQINGDFFRMASVANNRLVIGDSLSSATNYGIYMLNNLFAQYVNNSVAILPAGNTNSRCFYATGGSVNFAYNNALANYGAGYAMYAVNGNIFTEADNNSYHSNGVNLNYLSGGHADLAAWTAATGYDSNGVEVATPFVDMTSLKVCNDSLNGKGQPNALSMYDFEGEPRDMNTPDIGADEFMPVSAFTLGADLTLCDGDTIDYTVFFFDTVVWNGVDTNNFIQITNPSSYTVEVSGVCGVATDTLDVLAQVKATLPTTENICSDGSTVLDPGVGNGTYAWNDGSTDSTLMVDMPGTYSVEVVDEHGCYSTDTVTITQSTAVDLDETADLCEGDVIFLDAVLQGSYIWSDGSTNQILQVASAGSYSVTVTDAFGCITMDTTVVTEIPAPVAAWDTTTVSFFTVEFQNNSTGGVSYAWDFGDGTTSTDENPTHVYSNTWYDTCYVVSLTVTAPNNCGDDTYTDTVCVGEVLSVENGVSVEDQISMFPNPTTGQLNVTVITGGKDMTIEVVDIQGRQIMARNYGQVSGLVQNELDLTDVSKGVYLVKVILDGNTTVNRVTIK